MTDRTMWWIRLRMSGVAASVPATAGSRSSPTSATSVWTNRELNMLRAGANHAGSPDTVMYRNPAAAKYLVRS